MAWWRRDPSVWARTPIHRYARRTLRDHEAALRTRCFSKSNTKEARHKDEDDSRPIGISNLEWAQLQHYRRWKRRFEVDPFKALFGASESMLDGKGLENFEWIQRSLPRWIFKKMSLEESANGREKGVQSSSMRPQERASESIHRPKACERKVPPTNKTRPKQVEIDSEPAPKDREPLSAEPSFRNSKYERPFWSSGVDSPSDPRRLRDQSNSTPPDTTPSRKSAQTSDITERQVIDRTAKVTCNQGSENSTRPFHTTVASDDLVSPGKDAKTLDKEGNERETSFIKEFFADISPSQASSTMGGNPENNEWRQTTLDRRVSLSSTPNTRRRTNVPVIDVAGRQALNSNQDSANRSQISGVEQDDEEKLERRNLDSLQSSVATTGGGKVGRGALSWMLAPVHPGSQRNIDSAQQSTEHDDRTSPASARPVERAGSAELDMSQANKGHASALESKRPKPVDNVEDEWLVKVETFSGKSAGNAPKLSRRLEPRRPTSVILNQLPKDDMDFLSADEIRASMGRKSSQEGRTKLRETLEQTFTTMWNEAEQLDSMIQSNIMNDQYVRRKEREISQWRDQQRAERAAKQAETTPTLAQAAKETKTLHAPLGKGTVSTPPQPISILETSLDFMSRWLHTGGNALSMHFFQDPVEVLAEQNRAKNGNPEDPFLQGIVSGVQKGRRALRQIKLELEQDVKATKPLVDRLTSNERSVLVAAGLWDENSLASDAAANVRKLKARSRVRQLRQALVDTDKEFKAACEAIDSMKPPDLHRSIDASARARRFRLAADVLQKNAKLTRVILFGLQARLENMDASLGVNERNRDLAHRLLALQDTQLALARLVERTMQVLDIGPIVEEEKLAHKQSDIDAVRTATGSSVNESYIVNAEGSQLQRARNAAVKAKLEDEISKQKAAMRGLSDDGYSRSTKSVARKLFDVPSPLAHSLFRPFAQQLESMGKEADTEENTANKAAKSKKADKELVGNVKKAYEDAYGPITVEHRQVADEDKAVSTAALPQPKAEAPAVKSETVHVAYSESSSLPRIRRQVSLIQLLKEDQVSPNVSKLPHSSTRPSSGAMADPGTKQENPIEVSGSIPDLVGADPTAASVDATKKDFSTPVVAMPEQSFSDNLNPIKDREKMAALGGDLGPALHQSGSELEYRIFAYDLSKDEILITRSSAPGPTANTTRIPLHEALAQLSHPSEFLPYLPRTYEVVAANPTMLFLRSASSSFHTARDTIRMPFPADAPSKEEGWKGINPIDGTARLSPTGFMGDGLELEKAFEERRRAAGEHHVKFQGGERKRNEHKSWSRDRGKDRARVGVGGVIKTAIVAGAGCYVVGVVAELTR